MSDIFSEVEEEVRRERWQKLWKRYGDYAIAGAAVLIVGVAGYKLWEHYQYVETQKAAAGYLAALELSETGKKADAAAAFAKEAKDAPSGYAEIAELAAAGDYAAAGKSHEALALYRKIVAKHDDIIGQLARVRAAWLLADSGKKSEIEDLLAPLTGDKSGWRFMAREILAYVDYREGHLEEARTAYEKLAKDKDAPGSIARRAEAMASLLRTGIGDYGTVPEPQPEAKPGEEAPAAAVDTPKK